jgi:membrane-bound serine protease (ClpP class)
MMRLRAAIAISAIFLAVAAAPHDQPAASAPAAKRAIVLDVDGAIGPAMADYIVSEVKAANPSDTGLIVLRMNTPGGLDTSMRAIIAAILASPVPVATFVAPGGARAASAGTYIAYASAIAAMAPGTNIGAATPVQLGGGSLFGGGSEQKPQPAGKNGEPQGTQQGTSQGTPTDTETRKILNDAVAYIQSLATLNNRNANWATDAVRSAVSVPATEALSLHVIDVIATDVPDLLRQIDGKTVTVNGKPQRLATAGLKIVEVPQDWRTALFGLITNPDVAFLLMLVGIYGLILEFFNPGAVAPGLVGSICLLVALYALAFIPISYAGVALVIVGIGLMLAEVHIGAFGTLGVGGIAAFVIGALMMFPARGTGFTLSWGVVIGAAIGSAALILLALAALLRARKRPVVTGSEALIGAEGETIAWDGDEGRIRVQGEIWRARAASPLAAGKRVKVIGRDGLALRVEAM